MREEETGDFHPVDKPTEFGGVLLTETERHAIYAQSLADGLSDYEAREEAWPSVSPDTQRVGYTVADQVEGDPAYNKFRQEADRTSMEVAERGPIFDEIPSGLSIMHWFLDKTLAQEWVGCGGDADYILSWDPESESGSHVDLIAHVDHDDAWFWLLCVGTFLDGGSVTYDLLFVASNLDGKRSCEWRNEPTPEQPWHYEGLVWFAGQIEEYERTWHEAAHSGRKDQADDR